MPTPRTWRARLGIRLDTVAITDVFRAYEAQLADLDAVQGLAAENLQARIRGNDLMALSNRFGWLVLATGNKSEYAVGYSTLYGDMAGGFAPIKDVPKTLVYELCAWRNRVGPTPPIPEAVLTKPPSAELRPDQKDTDSLPAYEELDPIIAAYVEDDLGIDEIVTRGIGDRDHGRARRGDDRPGRVQTAPGRPGGQDHPEGLRAGPSSAHHEPIRSVTNHCAATILAFGLGRCAERGR